MITGKENLLNPGNITLTGSNLANPGFPLDNILEYSSLEVWEAAGDVQTITLVFTTPLLLQLIALVNIVCDESVTIETYNEADELLYTKTILTADLTGIRYKDTYMLLSAVTEIKKIIITFTGSSPDFVSSLGYLWAGEVIDFGCLEKITLADNSNDSTTITRGNTAETQQDYLYRTYSIIIKKENDLKDLQSKVREILLTGYGKPRPFIFDEPLFNPPDCCLGIFDSGKFQYDIFVAGADYLAQNVLGVREVF